MRLRRKKNRDPATRKLEQEGLLTFKRQNEQRTALRKIKEFGKITYDFWSGVKYIVILSAILWWIPLFGPMLAGYVGGRRTGGPKKGLFASIVGLGIIGAAYYLLTFGYVYLAFEWIVEYPDKIIAVATSHSFFGPYLEFFRLYWITFFDRVWAGVPFGSNSYILTMVFAYIGGIISYEKRKEFTDGLRSLDRVKDELSSLHRYAKNPMKKRNTSKVNKSSSHLNDLRSVKYNGQKRGQNGFNDYEDVNTSNQEDTVGRDKNVRQDRRITNFESELPRSQIRHHSESNGDDWEFL